MKTIVGRMSVGADHRYAIVASRFNELVVDRLVAGAVDVLERHGAAPDHLTLVRVPGSWEIPLVVDKLAKSGDYRAVIALGALIRGATAHFDYIAGQVSAGISRASLESGIPCVFGVLTTDSLEQALERAGSKAGNKGAEAALAAIEMVAILAQI
jgi:6,7-dimethyl-8-ribityllumazine synthase